jgi:hypothetical protein
LAKQVLDETGQPCLNQIVILVSCIHKDALVRAQKVRVGLWKAIATRLAHPNLGYTSSTVPICIEEVRATYRKKLGIQNTLLLEELLMERRKAK